MSLPHKAYDYLIVGSSLYGSTFAHFAHKQGKRCLVIDKENGGICIFLCSWRKSITMISKSASSR